MCGRGGVRGRGDGGEGRGRVVRGRVEGALGMLLRVVEGGGRWVLGELGVGVDVGASE